MVIAAVCTMNHIRQAPLPLGLQEITPKKTHCEFHHSGLLKVVVQIANCIKQASIFPLPLYHPTWSLIVLVLIKFSGLVYHSCFSLNGDKNCIFYQFGPVIMTVQNAVHPNMQVPFGYTRKDVLLIGLGITVIGIGLKSGLEYAGFDPLQAGNVVQLFIVLGLTVGWISTYIFRVSNKEMTYVQQLRDYENKVMEKRLDGLTEAELEALIAQVEEEKQQLASGEQVN